MKITYSQKHPYIFAVLVALLCTFMTALGAATPQVIGLDIDLQLPVTTAFLIISIVIGIAIMKKSRFSLYEYGFRRCEKDTYHKVRWYLPLLAIEILPIAVSGISSEVKALQFVTLLFFTVAVGFNEEIYFRGLAFQVLKEKGRKQAIIWSSVIFGTLHLVNALNGKDLLDLVLQMFFAFLVGIVLSEIVSITKSLWAVIVWHAAHDYISGITGDVRDKTALIILAVQVGFLLIYAIHLWKWNRSDNE